MLDVTDVLLGPFSFLKKIKIQDVYLVIKEEGPTFDLFLSQKGVNGSLVTTTKWQY